MFASKDAPRAPQQRFHIGDQVIVKEKALLEHRARRGLITEISSDGMECRVEFEDGRQPTTAYVLSKWLER